MNQEAERAKREGNDCMKQDKFIEAMLHYSRAVKIDPNNATYYSNRSLALLKLEQYFHAWDDAKKAIELMPKWPKGYLRKGEAERLAQRYKDAIGTFKIGLSLDPENNDLMQGYKQASDALKQQKIVDKRIPMYGTAIGVFLGCFILFLNEILVELPMLDNCLIKLLILIAVIATSYGCSRLYRYFKHYMTRYLLEPPPDFARKS